MKKTIPLVIHQSLQPIAKQNLHLIQPVINDNTMFSVKDKDEKSTFYFKVVKMENRGGILFYSTNRKPASEDNIEEITGFHTIKDVVQIFNLWLKIIESYNQIETFFDDPIIKTYKKGFIEKFTLVEKDADILPFSLEQQLFLDQYLSDVKEVIEVFKEKRDEEFQKDFFDLEKEIDIIKSNLTKDSKNKIIERLSTFWAKTQKVGLDVLKEVFVSVVSDLTKKLITGQ